MTRAEARRRELSARRRLYHERRINRGHEAYLRQRFTRDDSLPFGPHAGAPIRALPEPYLLGLEHRGLLHAQLYGLLVHEREIRTTARQVGGGC